MNSTKEQDKEDARAYRREDFIEIYEWQLKDHSEMLCEIKIPLYLRQSLLVRIICLDRKISIAEFIRVAMRKNINSIPHLLKMTPDKKLTTTEIKTDIPLHEKYDLGLKLIDNGISWNEFVRQSIYKALAGVKIENKAMMNESVKKIANN